MKTRQIIQYQATAKRLKRCADAVNERRKKKPAYH